MKKLGHLKSYKMTLTTLTPIYIGAGVDCCLNPLQYYIDNKKLNIIDESKFSKFLIRNNLMENFINFITTSKNPKFFEWLKNNNLLNKNLDIYSKSQLLSNINANNKKNDIRTFCRNIEHKAYIPGSSIKGAFRTVLLSQEICKNKEHYTKKYWNELKESLLKNDKKNLNRICSNIEKEAFSMNKFNSIQADSAFRGLQVSDTTGVTDDRLYFAQKEDLSPNKLVLSQIPLWREYLKTNTNFEFNITIDTTMFHYDINEILKSMNDYAERINSTLREKYNNIDIKNIYLPDESNENITPNMCIGGGAGFLTKTIIYDIAPDFESARYSMSCYLDKSFTTKNKFTRERIPAHNHKLEDKIISPRTLKLAKEQEDYLCVGWAFVGIKE